MGWSLLWRVWCQWHWWRSGKRTDSKRVDLILGLGKRLDDGTIVYPPLRLGQTDGQYRASIKLTASAKTSMDLVLGQTKIDRKPGLSVTFSALANINGGQGITLVISHTR
ncbi:hypothetical protein GA0061078_0763 [Bifidobacterium bohemicum]|uniref:Uncharacterized protein n=1 Tax=Bifidobacterium bohemicum DSM 22767 TaxID=1437606 RepID=A0A086ZKF3_9BIFI|nr:hypothetical protein BBOH_0478 [Bifidobacterium bohemicum DSM 22767]SCB87413.1 hypothetical protein GA0061078_0763 [Bifidobacterium bohemicum]